MGITTSTTPVEDFVEVSSLSNCWETSSARGTALLIHLALTDMADMDRKVVLNNDRMDQLATKSRLAGRASIRTNLYKLSRLGHVKLLTIVHRYHERSERIIEVTLL